MNEASSHLDQRYASALETYLSNGGEAALEGAYEIGRQALTDGIGVLEMADIHQSAVRRLLLRNSLTVDHVKEWRASDAFFTESLSPYEMTQRGFQEAYASLRQMNESLFQQAKELKQANSRLTKMLNDQKRSEAQIKALNEDLQRRTNELEVLNKELDAFSYSVSHDLKAPLRTIDGFSQAILEDYGDQLDEHAKSYLSRVCSAASHMSQIIDDLLALSHVSTHSLSRAPIDLGKMASSIVENLHQAQPERQVEVKIGSNLLVSGDAHLVNIALVNLLGNAWKFTQKRGPGAQIEFRKRQMKGETVFSISDNGAGFDPEFTHKLFTAFQRLHSTREFPGTGIGLVTVQRIIHRHGGRIWAEGKLGVGATFYFTLPQEKREKNGS